MLDAGLAKKLLSLNLGKYSTPIENSVESDNMSKEKAILFFNPWYIGQPSVFVIIESNIGYCSEEPGGLILNK